MSGKYKNVRADDMYIRTSGKLREMKESQLDRIENKLDKLLNLVGDKEQSVCQEENRRFISVPKNRETYRPLFVNTFK